MKRLIALILALVCTVLFVGCAKQSTYLATDVENVKISITAVSSTGATVKIKDTNNEPHVYGEWYKIEKQKDGNWYDVKTVIKDYGFNEIAYIPNESGDVEFNVDWEWLYGKLPAGKYRLLKQSDSEYISVEFDIA